MRFAKAIGLVLVGAAIGAALSSGAVRSVEARQRDAGRFTTTKVPGGKIDDYNWTFLKDTKSGGCWIVQTSKTAGMMAPAPKEACE